VKEQTIALIKEVRHASIIGISDHFEYLVDDQVCHQFRCTSAQLAQPECGPLCMQTLGIRETLI
jgi:hypothetical protein